MGLTSTGSAGARTKWWPRHRAIAAEHPGTIQQAIVDLRELPFSGKDAGFAVTIRGTYQTNNDLYNA